MLILTKSSLKDYYDGVVQTSGIDKTIVYDRQPKISNWKDKDFPEFLKRKLFQIYWSSKKEKDNISPIVDLEHYNSPSLKPNIKYKSYQYIVVGFCGKLYIGFKFFYINDDNELDFDIIYDFNEIKTIIAHSKRDNFKERYDKIANLDLIDKFREYNTPIFVYESSYSLRFDKFNSHYYEKFIINPLLKYYQFYKVFGSYQAFQEISMFLGGVLGSNGKEIVEVDNRTKIIKHGFDLKTSFRKDKKI
jgi:hypothetical protein